MSASTPPDRSAAREIVVSVTDPLAPEVIAEVMRELPSPTSLEPGEWVALRVVAPERSFWQRLRDPSPGALPPLAVGCTALLAAGYTLVTSDGELTAYGRTEPTRDGQGGV